MGVRACAEDESSEEEEEESSEEEEEEAEWKSLGKGKGAGRLVRSAVSPALHSTPQALNTTADHRTHAG